MTTISVTRALAQIKTLDARIVEAAAKQFVGVAINGKERNTQASVDESSASYKANLQSVQDMIAFRSKLKSAVVESNAKTVVEIAGQTMTVAQAIERKSSIGHEQTLLNALKTQRRAATLLINRNNDEMKVRLDKLIETAVGKDRKVDDNEVAAIVNPFVASNEATLIDALNIDSLTEKLEAEISAFVTEVDYALSEVNAITQITLPE